MLDLLSEPFADGPAIAPLQILTRLLVALALGIVVAWVYRKTRGITGFTPTFPTTLVLLAILIAMVTQVIGDNVARAFSLVGALSIVRFRTVVRDTQDTAFVIFAVVVGMAVGAHNLWTAVIGMGVVGLAAFLMRPAVRPSGSTADTSFRLELRVATGQDLDGPIEGAIDEFVAERRLVSVGTAKQGMSLSASYQIRFRPGRSAEELVRALNRIDGVQNVDLLLNEPGELAL